MARPKSRAETVIFSRKAVVCRDADGTLCLSFRVGDFRSSQLIGVRINALLVQRTSTQRGGGGGGHVPLRQDHLRVATETDDADFFFLAWPIKVVHRIDDASPLWPLSPEALLMSGVEIIVILEACCEATGATTQVLTTSGWLGSRVAKALDLQLARCEFNSRPRRCRVTTLGKVVYTHVPQQVAVF